MADGRSNAVYEVDEVRQASIDYRAILEFREISNEIREIRKFLWLRQFVISPIAFVLKLAAAGYLTLTVAAWLADESSRKQKESVPAPATNPAGGGAGIVPPPFGAKPAVPAPATGPLVPYQGKLPDGGKDNVKPAIPPNNPATQQPTVPPDNPMKQLSTIPPANPTIPPIGRATAPGIPPIGCATPPGMPPVQGARTTNIPPKGD